MKKRRSAKKFGRSTIFSFLVGCCLACSANASDSWLPDRVTIYGHEYELELVENIELREKLRLNRSASVGAHYRGKLVTHSDSWVRVSSIGGRWTGLVSFNSQMFTIDGNLIYLDNLAIGGPKEATRLVAAPVVDYGQLNCGNENHAHGLFESPKHSALQSFAPVPYTSVCEQSIGVHCVFAEAEFVFDPAFRQAFPDNTDSEALSIINMVEGAYLNAFGIALDTISFRTQGASEFSATTEAGDLLDDIYDKRVRGQISGDINDQSLFHLITGRNFNDDTAGVAFFDTLCTSSAIGTSQVIRDGNGESDTRVTALVVAHEFGHNFGADHDIEDNTCGAGFIMEPTIQGGAGGFSTCSLTQIETSVSNVPDLATCFNFPISLWSRAADSNVKRVAAGQVFTHDYEVTAREGYQSIETLSVAGTVVPGQGQFEAVTLDGLPCDIGIGSTDYQCLRNDPETTLALSYSVRQVGASAELIVTDTLEAVGNADRDLALTNSVLPVFIIRTTVDHAPPNSATDLMALFYYSSPGAPVDLAWIDNSNNEEGFRIERRFDGGAFEEIGWTNEPEYRDKTTSEAGDRYEYRIIAFNAAGAANPSNIARAQLRLPDPVSSLTAQFSNETEIHLQWGGQLSNIEDGIRIERSINGSGFVEIGSVGADIDQFIDVSPILGSVHEYRVFAFNAAGDAPASNIATITPILVPIPILDIAAVQRPGTTTVDISWIENSDNEDGFRIERRSQGTEFGEIGVVGANSVGFTDASAAPGMIYEYRVLAFNIHGDSESSAIVNIGVVGVPVSASAVTASQGTGVSVTVRWADNSDSEEGFSILRSEGSADFLLRLTAAAGSTSAIDSGVQIGVTYRYRVVAFNLVGESAPSDSAPITIVNNPCCTSGGGGGGSVDWLLLLAVALLFLRERKLTGAFRW